MKLKHFIITFLLCILAIKVSAQNIYSALHHNDGYDIKKEYPVKEITTKTIFYNANGNEVGKDVVAFNDQQNVTVEIRYNENGRMTTRLTWMYDATGIKSIARKLESWSYTVGNNSTTAFYGYDENGYLIKVTDKDKFGKIVRYSVITNDEKGYPIELKLTEGSTDFGKEIAEYDLDNNEVTFTSIGSNGKTLSANSQKIDFKKYNSNEIVDENGNLLKSDNYVYIYKYDKNLNWIKQTRFKIVNGQQIKNAKFTRDIKYVKK